jgi:hypothetical protein
MNTDGYIRDRFSTVRIEATGSNLRRDGAVEAGQDPACIFDPLAGKLRILFGIFRNAQNILCHAPHRTEDEIGSKRSLPHDLLDCPEEMLTHVVFGASTRAWALALFVVKVLSRRAIAKILRRTSWYNKPDAGPQPIGQNSSSLGRDRWPDVFFEHHWGLCHGAIILRPTASSDSQLNYKRSFETKAMSRVQKIATVAERRQ